MEHDNRELYPEEHRFEEPEGWTVYEVKNQRHVLFEHKATEAILHVEGDGMSPIVSFDAADEYWTDHSAETFQEALENAKIFMAAVRIAFQIGQSYS